MAVAAVQYMVYRSVLAVRHSGERDIHTVYGYFSIVENKWDQVMPMLPDILPLAKRLSMYSPYRRTLADRGM
jgi:hypothetical protein